MMKLYDIIIESSKAALSSQNKNGSMSPGHNGPYKDPETPVRNTSHWIVTFLKVYDITKEQVYLDAAEKGMTYLLDKEARPMDASFWHRKNPEKDFANGLVGQAWTIEALIELFKHFSNDKTLNIAKKVFLMHPFNEKFSAWERLNVDGSYNSFDPTFNHQLWFAAIGGLLFKATDDKIIGSCVKAFINKLDASLSLYPDGLIEHRSYKYLVSGSFMKGLRFIESKSKGRDYYSYMRMKSFGYHGFNLYALALLKQCFPESIFWNSKMLNKAISFANSKLFKMELSKSQFGFPYNVPGFEIAYAFQQMSSLSDELIAEWVSWQINTCYNFEKNLMVNGGTYDENTAAARIYEGTRLKNYELTLDR